MNIINNKLDKIDKTILIVDDNPDYLKEMEEVVGSFGFKTIIANGQKKAEEILEHTKPDLAIYDLVMEKDDSGFILSYRTKKKYPNLPIIMISAVTSKRGMTFSLDTKLEKQWIKADVFLPKGIRYDQLHREIEKLLKM